MYLPSVRLVSWRGEAQTCQGPATPSLVSRQRNVEPDLVLSNVNVGALWFVSDLGLAVIVVSGGESAVGAPASPMPSWSPSAWSVLALSGQLSPAWVETVSPSGSAHPSLATVVAALV